MNIRIPIQDVILALGCAGFAISPWPWLVLLYVAGWMIFIALVVDARTSPQEVTAPAPGETGGES